MADVRKCIHTSTPLVGSIRGSHTNVWDKSWLNGIHFAVITFSIEIIKVFCKTFTNNVQYSKNVIGLIMITLVIENVFVCVSVMITFKLDYVVYNTDLRYTCCLSGLPHWSTTNLKSSILLMKCMYLEWWHVV